MRKWICMVVLALTVLWMVSLSDLPDTVEAVAKSGTAPLIIIDAGHGGEDGGAVSLSGIPESQINLSIALKLEELLSFYGIPVQMTRREDISLHSQDAETLREKKASDLRHRVACVNEAEAPVLLSIHQNSYPDSRYSGAQVFFADTYGSDRLADHVQTVLNDALRFQSIRKPQKIPETVYLMNHIECPAVLVECGFLTNPEEESLLLQQEYQKKFSLCLADAVLTAQNPYDYC